MDNVETAEMLDTLQNAVIDENNKQIKNNPKDKYHFDRLKMYFGEDFETPSGIIISQPTIGDILEIGEEKFYHSLSPLLYNSTSIRLQLWEANMDWNKIKDIQVFSMLIPLVDKEPLSLFFKNLRVDDLKLYDMKKREDDKQTSLVLYSSTQNIMIDEEEYMLIAEYIREIMNVHPKVEKARGKTAKTWIIQEEKMNLQNRLKEGNKNTSTLLPLVSTCVNYPGFKYKLQDLKEVGICQFMDSVQRIQKYESAIAALRGCYSGFVDTSKMKKETFNFMGDI